MDYDQAVALLPVAYATALRLRAAGIEPAGIAERLDVPTEAVGPLLAIAEAKLARLLQEPVPDV